MVSEVSVHGWLCLGQGEQSVMAEEGFSPRGIREAEGWWSRAKRRGQGLVQSPGPCSMTSPFQLVPLLSPSRKCQRGMAPSAG